VRVMFIGLKGRRIPAQGESLGLPAVQVMFIGLKGRRIPAQGESPGNDRRNSHGFSTSIDPQPDRAQASLLPPESHSLAELDWMLHRFPHRDGPSPKQRNTKTGASG